MIGENCENNGDETGFYHDYLDNSCLPNMVTWLYSIARNPVCLDEQSGIVSKKTFAPIKE